LYRVHERESGEYTSKIKLGNVYENHVCVVGSYFKKAGGVG